MKYLGVKKKIDQRPKHVVLWNFLFEFFLQQKQVGLFFCREKNFKKPIKVVFFFKMLQVSVFTIKFGLSSQNDVYQTLLIYLQS